MNLTPGAGNREVVTLGLLLAGLVIAIANPASASGMIAPGDSQLRDDIQLLAAWDFIEGPTTTWPLAWRQIEADLQRPGNESEIPEHVRRALSRVRHRLKAETGHRESMAGSRISVAGDAGLMRSFQSTPRDAAELQGTLGWQGERLQLQLAATAVREPSDGESFRADGSRIGIRLGNFSLAAAMSDRWWGPGWEGSLILSSNARPFPAITLDRERTRSFDSKWLSWIGPWDLSMMAGQLESDRHVPNPRFLGFRFTARPHTSFEFGISRTALWCGEGRPCDFDTFTELLRGNDNRGDSGVSGSNEPGNQLAGVDLRWTPRWFDRSISFYGQFIGEDEAGGLPSRYLGQMGIERTGNFGLLGNYRWFAEYAGTSCDFYKRREIFNCAYNHTIYQTGYRYRGRSIGHPADNDSKILAIGLFVTANESQTIQSVVRAGRLNRIGPPDPRNSITAARLDLVSADFMIGRFLTYGQVSVGVGYDYTRNAATNSSESGGRAFIEWRSHASF